MATSSLDNLKSKYHIRNFMRKFTKCRLIYSDTLCIMIPQITFKGGGEILHKVLSEDDMKRKAQKAKIANYTIFAILLLILLSIIAGYFVYRYQHTFYSDRWLSEPNKRTDMIDNFLQNHEIIGLTEAEILSLLGPHDNAQGAFNEDNRYVYYLGPERGLFSIDSEWLLIDFTNGVVSDYSLATD